jgi:hypothetical protein
MRHIARYNPARDVALLEELGSRQAFQDAINAAALDPNASPKFQKFVEEVQKFLRDLVRLDKTDRSISWIARRHGISITELADLYRNYSFTKAYLEAFDRLPAIVKETVDNCFNTEACCPRCDGSGSIHVEAEPDTANKPWIKRKIRYELRECPSCRGSGKVKIEGSDKARGRIWQMVGFEKPSQTNVTIQQQQISGESVIEELEALDRKRIAKSDIKAVEAAFEEIPPEPAA